MKRVRISLVCGIQARDSMFGFTSLVSRVLPVDILHSSIVDKSAINDGYIVSGTGTAVYDDFFEDIKLVSKTRPCLYIYMYQVPEIKGVVVVRDACEWSELSTCFLEAFGHLLDAESKKKMSEMF